MHSDTRLTLIERNGISSISGSALSRRTTAFIISYIYIVFLDDYSRMAWSSPRWTGKVPILRYTCSRTFTRTYNVPNDCVPSPTALSASRISISLLRRRVRPQHLHKSCTLAAAAWHHSQSAQSAAGAPYTVRGGQHLRPPALPQRCFRCITRLPHG